MNREDIHTCSYSCERPACIKAQRDELVRKLPKLVAEAVAAEREACAKENAELLQALQNLHQRCHWADAPEEMDAAKAAIEKAIRARGEV